MSLYNSFLGAVALATAMTVNNIPAGDVKDLSLGTLEAYHDKSYDKAPSVLYKTAPAPVA